jgi:hypothetical protein
MLVIIQFQSKMHGPYNIKITKIDLLRRPGVINAWPAEPISVARRPF